MNNYVYVITLKNGKEYKVGSAIAVNEFIKSIMPSNQFELKFNHFDIIDSDGRCVAFLGNEVCSIEYFVSK